MMRKYRQKLTVKGKSWRIVRAKKKTLSEGKGAWFPDRYTKVLPYRRKPILHASIETRQLHQTYLVDRWLYTFDFSAGDFSSNVSLRFFIQAPLIQLMA